MAKNIKDKNNRRSFFKSLPYSMLLALVAVSFAIFGMFTVVSAGEVTYTTSILLLSSLIGALLFWGSLTDYPS